MRKRILVGLAVGLFIFSVVSSANAVPLTMNFDSVAHGTDIANGGTYIENGMKITSFSDYSQIGSPLSDPTNLFNNNGFYFHGTNQYIKFEMVDGSSFNLLNFDLATNGFTPRWLKTSYSPTTNITLPNTPTTYSTIIFSGPEYTNITWFSVHTAWYATELDNITIDTNTSPAPVPEPATMFLFGTGLAGLVRTKLRRKKK